MSHTQLISGQRNLLCTKVNKKLGPQPSVGQYFCEVETLFLHPTQGVKILVTKVLREQMTKV